MAGTNRVLHSRLRSRLRSCCLVSTRVSCPVVYRLKCVLHERLGGELKSFAARPVPFLDTHSSLHSWLSIAGRRPGAHSGLQSAGCICIQSATALWSSAVISHPSSFSCSLSHAVWCSATGNWRSETSEIHANCLLEVCKRKLLVTVLLKCPL